MRRLVLLLAVILVLAVAAASAQSNGFTLRPSQGVRLSDQTVLKSGVAADLAVTVRYQGQTASLALTAAKIQSFPAPPDLSQLTAAQIEQYPDAVSPTAGDYYVIKARDGQYYLCQLTELKNQDRSPAAWRLTFTSQAITLSGGGPVAIITPAGAWRGQRTYPDGSVYDGEFLDGQRHGHGIYKWPDGTVYEGGFVHGQRQGQGTYTWPDGAVYKGDFQAGQFHGHGVLTWPDGASYDGDWVEGKRSGHGTYRWANGFTYVGEFRDNQRCGAGTLYDADGRVVQQGQWRDDKFVGP